MTKKTIDTIYEKNLISQRIIDSLIEKEDFLILGHKNPDEDCIGSTVAMGLLLAKFSKNVYIYQGFPIHDHFQYLLKICRYNNITLLSKGDSLPEAVDVIITCDTPKPSMLDIPRDGESLIKDQSIQKIEIDHHLGADSDYIGDRETCLVTEASSASELVGYLALKIRNKKELLDSYNIEEIFTRNFVLAILTGIIGDSKMGNFLKSRREKKYYSIFSTLYNSILSEETVKETNLANMQEVFTEIQKLSNDENECSEILLEKSSTTDYFGKVIMSPDDMEKLFARFNTDTVVSTTRGVADLLAEKSGHIGFVIYYDNPDRSDLIHFRMRRSKKFKNYDLREVLSSFSIENGGGHEGAIAFRIPRGEVEDINRFTEDIITAVTKQIS